MKYINKPLNKITNSFCEVDYSEIIFPIITVYKFPLDFPNKYVARLFDRDLITNVIMVKDTLEEIREGIPRNMMRMMPSPEDDKCIFEIYI